jgi:hypothetical protein
MWLLLLSMETHTNFCHLQYTLLLLSHTANCQILFLVSPATHWHIAPSSPLSPANCPRDSNETASIKVMNEWPPNSKSKGDLSCSASYCRVPPGTLSPAQWWYSLLWFGEKSRNFGSGRFIYVRCPAMSISTCPRFSISPRNLCLLWYSWDQGDDTVTQAVATTRLLAFLLLAALALITFGVLAPPPSVLTAGTFIITWVTEKLLNRHLFTTPTVLICTPCYSQRSL